MQFKRLLRMQLLLLAFSTLLPSMADGAVSIVVLPERYYLGHRPDDIGVTIHNFDLNADALNDILIGNTGSGLTAYTTSANAIVHEPALPPDVGGDAAPLWLGAIIGVNPGDIFPSLIWEGGNSGMVICRDIGCAGLFLNQTAALGLRFEASDRTHYGFLQFEPDRDTPGGWITGWAYETIPDTPITVQPIPEPTTIGLLAAGTSLLWTRNAANRKENKALQRTARSLLVSTLSLLRKFLGFGGAQPRP